MVTTSMSLTGELLCLITAQSTVQNSSEKSLYSMNLYLISFSSSDRIHGSVQSCARSSSDLTLGSISLPNEH